MKSRKRKRIMIILPKKVMPILQALIQIMIKPVRIRKKPINQNLTSLKEKLILIQRVSIQKPIKQVNN